MADEFAKDFENYDGPLDRQMRNLLEPVIHRTLFNRRQGQDPDQPPPRYSRQLFNTVDHVFLQQLRRRDVPREVRDYATHHRRTQLLVEYLGERMQQYEERMEELESIRLVENMERGERRSERQRRRDEQSAYYQRSMFAKSTRIFEEAEFQKNETTCVSFVASRNKPRVTIDVDDIKDLMKNRHVKIVRMNKKISGQPWLPFLHIQLGENFRYNHFRLIIREMPRYFVGVRLYTPVTYYGTCWKGSCNAGQETLLEKTELNHKGREIDENGHPVPDDEVGVGQQPSSDPTTVTDDTPDSEPRDPAVAHKLKARQDMEYRRRKEQQLLKHQDSTSTSTPPQTPPRRPAPPAHTHPSNPKGTGKTSERARARRKSREEAEKIRNKLKPESDSEDEQ